MSYDCFCDYDQPQFYNVEVRKARKRHRCFECGAPILPSEKYEAASGKWDGSVDTFRTCQHCVDLRIWVKNNVPCLCWAHGNLIEDCREAIGEACYRAPQETVGLRFGLARRVAALDRINKEKRAASAVELIEPSERTGK